MSVERIIQRITQDITALPLEQVYEVADFVQFLKQKKGKGVPLEETGLGVREAKSLKWRLRTFEEDWEAPGMEAYDDFSLLHRTEPY